MKEDFTIVRALGLGFRTWFRNFLPITGMSIALFAPVLLWLAVVDLESAGSYEDLLNMLFVWPLFAMTGLATLLAPMLTYRVIQDLNGVRVSMWTSIRHGVRGFVPAIMIAVAVNVLNAMPGGFFGIVGAMVTCIYFVSAPAAVVERIGAMEALTRSSVLTFQRRWSIFGLLLPIGGVVLLLVFGWIQPMLSEPDADLFGSLRRTALVFIGVCGLLFMFKGILEAVTYTLLREEKDGISKEELARVFE